MSLDLLKESPNEKTITYQCCSILGIIGTRCPSAIYNVSETIITTILDVLPHHHQNIEICGTIFGILSACAFEEKYVNYLLNHKLSEFQFMCKSIPMFQVIYSF